MYDRLTESQREFLTKLLAYIRDEGRPPTTREMQEFMKLKSPRSVSQYLDVLEDAGYIERSKGARNIRILQTLSRSNSGNGKTVQVPIVGVASCGFPLLAEENIEDYVSVSDKIAKSSFGYFILKAKGDSMNKAGINNGDLVLVRQQPTAENNDIVVALINDEAVIKRLRFTTDYMILDPESTNNEYKRIILENDFQIQGVVVKAL